MVTQAFLPSSAGDLASLASASSLFAASAIEKLERVQAELLPLAERYDVVVANPPYMGGRNMNNRLLEKIVAEYPQGKPDLYSAFILKAMRMTRNNGFSAMITQHSWMFLSSFETLRQTYLNNLISPPALPGSFPTGSAAELDCWPVQLCIHPWVHLILYNPN